MSQPVLSRGLRFMALSALAFSLMSVLVKQAAERLPTQEIVFVRALVSLAISLALLRRAGVHGLGTRRGLLLLRGLWGYAALSCVFFSVSRLPLAEATMLQYLHPTLTAVLAVLVLGERGDRALAASLALGTAGVALVVRPAFLFGGAHRRRVRRRPRALAQRARARDRALVPAGRCAGLAARHLGAWALADSRGVGVARRHRRAGPARAGLAHAGARARDRRPRDGALLSPDRLRGAVGMAVLRGGAGGRGRPRARR